MEQPAMSEDEAIAVISRELMTPLGFLAGLRRGEGLNLEGLRESLNAIDVLGQYWQGQLSVPKRAVFVLAHADDAFGLLAYGNPYVNVARVASDCSAHTKRALRPTEWAQVEAQVPEGSPDRLLMDVFTAAHPFIAGLRERQGINQQMVDLMFDAFSAVQAKWRQQQRISRGVAYALAGARGVVAECAANYYERSQSRAAVLDLANAVGERVLRCLDEPRAEPYEQARLPL